MNYWEDASTIRIGIATFAAIRSGLFNARRLGTSSPIISERYVMVKTTMANAIA